MRARPAPSPSLALAVLLATAAGCYGPTIADGRYTCAAEADCPAGLHCATTCGKCVRDPAAPGACTPVSPCTAGTMARSVGDPGLQNVAFCPAAFALPGATTISSCGRKPPVDGKGCAMSDSCATGWHVCVEADLVAAGLTKTECGGGSLAGFWATAQLGQFNKLSQTAVCADAQRGPVFGCGTTGTKMVQCMTMVRAAVNGGALAPEDCPSGFMCGTLNSDLASDVLTKPSVTSPGGVICCR